MRAEFKVLLVDAVLLIAEYSVIQDLSWRSGYAASPQDRCAGICSYTPSFGHNILTQYFTMAGNGVSLTSPPTLDWVQLLGLALVLVNVWYGYNLWLKRRQSKGPVAALPPQT